jgi:type IV pilus assembly protein PilN
MKISVNLATRPFVELRPLFARLRLAMAVLALLAIGLGFGLHALNVRAKAAQAQMDALKEKTLAFQKEKQSNEARMRQPQNRGVLERSQFLNAVFAEKSFSWTAVMMDLEKVLPVGVQVTSLEPQIAKDGSVNIRLRVSGDRDRAVQLVRNLEKSQRFVAPRLANEAAQAADSGRAGQPTQFGGPVVAPGAVEFDILSGYNPLPATPALKQTSSDVKGVKDSGARRPASAKSQVGRHTALPPKEGAR